MIGEAPNCLWCKKYNKNDFEKLSCKKYPEGIPDEIVDGEKKCEFEELQEEPVK